MSFKLIIFTVFLLSRTCRARFSPIVAPNFNCSLQEVTKAEVNVKSCLKQLDSDSLSTCDKFDEIVANCVGHIENCLAGDEEIRQYKDILIVKTMNILDKGGRTHEYQNCSVVQEFMGSERSIYRETAKCSAEEVENVSKMSERCIKHERSKMNMIFSGSDPLNDKEIKGVLCNFVRKVTIKCLRKNMQCLNKTDFTYVMSSGQLILTNFLNFLNVPFSFEECLLKQN